MDLDTLHRHIVDNFAGTDVMEADGNLFFVHDPDRDLPDVRRRPWATIVTWDHPSDATSNLDRTGVFRLSIGVAKAEFRELFPVDGEHDASVCDVLVPHPVYGSQYWVCVLNPDTTWPTVAGMLERAHARAACKHAGASTRRR